jgi:cephalosporin hydroxylase
MYQLFKKILPNNIKNNVWRMTQKMVQKKMIDADRNIPKYSLEEKHIRNLKVLTNRQKLLEIMPQNGIVAELGVDKGGFSQLILETSTPKKLHLIDVWNTKRYHSGLKLDIETKFRKLIENNVVEINYGLSTDAYSQFKDNYFDWIYIDTDHSYYTTIAELELYAPKIKQGGIIAGHDFIIGNLMGLTKYGVIQAVYEFCVRRNWELIYITSDFEEFPSFAIKKL